jgi:hypothetical protein
VPVRSRFPHFEAIYQEALAAEQQAAAVPVYEPTAPAPVETPQPAEPSRFAGVWNWISSLFD